MGSICKNLMYNTIYQLLLIALPLITAPYLARTLGMTATGIYTYTNSVAYYFVLVGALGISQHGNRSIAMVRDNEKALNHAFCCIMTLQLITFVLSLAAYGAYFVVFAKENRLITALQTIYILSGMLDISWLYFGLEKFRVTVLRNAAVKIATLVAILTMVHDSDDLWKYTLIMVAGQLFSQLYLWFLLPKIISPVKIKIRDVLAHLKPALVLFVPVLAYSVYKVMDKIMLGNMADYDQVGLYTYAEKIISIPVGILTAVGTVMLPRITNLAANGDQINIHRYIQISTKAITIVIAAAGFGLIGISRVFTDVFYGPAFAGCTKIIMLLSLTVFFIAWANITRTQYLIPMHRDRVYLLSTIFGAVLNFFANVCLIPVFQAAGAAIGTIIAEMSVMLIQVVAIRKEVPMLRYISSYTPVLVIGMLMSAMVWCIGNLYGPAVSTLLLQIASGGLFFVALVLLYLKMSKDELWYILLEVVKRFLRKGKQN